MTERIEFAGYSSEFQRDPLPDAMDAAADTLVAATERFRKDGSSSYGDGKHSSDVDWRPCNLRRTAQRWRAADQDREAVCGELATILENLGLRAAAKVAAVLCTQFDITPKPDRVVGGSPAMMMGVGPWERDAPDKPVVDPYYSEAFGPMRGGA